MAHKVPAEARDEPERSGGGSNNAESAEPGHRDLDLTDELPSVRADLDMHRVLVKASLPFGGRWLFRFERLARRDRGTE